MADGEAVAAAVEVAPLVPFVPARPPSRSCAPAAVPARTGAAITAIVARTRAGRRAGRCRPRVVVPTFDGPPRSASMRTGSCAMLGGSLLRRLSCAGRPAARPLVRAQWQAPRRTPPADRSRVGLQGPDVARGAAAR